MGQRPLPSPQRPDTSSAKVIAAILFVVLMIVIFGQRILSAGLEDEPKAFDRRSGGSPDGGPGESGSAALKIRYPDRCLKEASRPDGLGAIAAQRPEGISVATPTGQSLASIRATGPLGWSPSGSFLATGDGKLWTATGDPVRGSGGASSDGWAWSPRADCLLTVDRDGLRVAVPGRKPSVVASERISTFAFSPSGSKLMVVVEDKDRKRGGIWLADLKTEKMHVILNASESRGRWLLNGWSRAERPILMRPPGVTSGSGPAKVSFPAPGTSTTCGDEIVVVRGGRLATFGVTRPPEFVAADDTFRYLSVTCSPDAAYLATVRVLKGAGPEAARLVLLTREGELIRELTDGPYRDAAPSWGPTGTGVVFVREQLGDGGLQLAWFIPEGGVLQAIGLPVVSDAGVPVLDWSADGVPGHPTGDQEDG